MSAEHLLTNKEVSYGLRQQENGTLPFSIKYAS